MEQLEACCQCHMESLLRASGDGRAFPSTDLRDLDVPVAELVPKEVADDAARLAKLIVVQQSGRYIDRCGQSTEQPALGQARFCRDDFLLAHATSDESEGVPDLVHEVAALVELGLRDARLIARRNSGQEAPAQCIGAVLVDELEWID